MIPFRNFFKEPIDLELCLECNGIEESDGEVVAAFPNNDETFAFLDSLTEDVDYAIFVESDSSDEEPTDDEILEADDIYLAIYNLDEARKRTIRISSTGEKQVKIKCGKGYKWNPHSKKCVVQTGKEKRARRISIKKAVKTRKRKGSGFAKMTTKKRLKALKKRSQRGL